MTSPLGIDLDVLDRGVDRLERALDLVRGIRDQARELDALINDPDDPVAPALEAAARMNGNGASPPDAPAELGPAPAPSSDSKPAPAPSTIAPPASPGGRDDSPAAAPAPRRGRAVDAVLDYFEAHPREWLGLMDLTRGLGLKRSTAQRAIRELSATETIENNGRATAGRRYRLDQGLADELERPDPEAETASPIDPGADDPSETDGDDGGIRIDPGAGPERGILNNTGAATSTRTLDEDTVNEALAGLGSDVRVRDRDTVRRDLERTAGLAPPRRSAPVVGRRPDVALNGPQGAARDELKDRVRRRLLDEASTISELARDLDVERRDLAPVVIELANDDGEPIVPVPGATRGVGRAETIYSNVA